MQTNVVFLPNSSKLQTKLLTVLSIGTRAAEQVKKRINVYRASADVVEITALRRIIFSHEMSIQQLALTTSIPIERLMSIVYGMTVPTDGEALRISSTLGMSVWELWNRLLFKKAR